MRFKSNFTRPVTAGFFCFCSLGSRSLRQLFAGLLARHVLGIPVRPIRIRRADAVLVLAMRGRRTAKRAREIVRRREGRACGVYATGQPRRDFLKQPAVAVRITERSERPVTAMLGIGTADADASKQVG